MFSKEMLSIGVPSDERQHIDFYAREDGNRLELCPRNLFTTLLLVGMYVPYEEVKDKRQYVDDVGNKFSYSDDGDIFVKPVKPAEHIEFSFKFTPDGEINVQE